MSQSRDYALQFLYQCECEKLYHFSEAHFNHFIKFFNIPSDVAKKTKKLVQGSIESQNILETKINEFSKNWTVDRMPATDRLVLKIACLEIIENKTPFKIIINEAVELAKKYGTTNSGSFVNAVLDKLANAQTTP